MSRHLSLGKQKFNKCITVFHYLTHENNNYQVIIPRLFVYNSLKLEHKKKYIPVTKYNGFERQLRNKRTISDSRNPEGKEL